MRAHNANGLVGGLTRRAHLSIGAEFQKLISDRISKRAHGRIYRVRMRLNCCGWSSTQPRSVQIGARCYSPLNVKRSREVICFFRVAGGVTLMRHKCRAPSMAKRECAESPASLSGIL